MARARKRITRAQLTGQKGINLIEKHVLDIGFLWHPTGNIEAGIDGTIEIRDDATGDVLNNIVQVQSKATEGTFPAETADGFEWTCAERDLDYWMQGNAPVILVVSRPNQDEAYWVAVKDYFRNPAVRQTRKVCFDKCRHRFDEGCKDAAFFRSALTLLGGSIREREPGRYEITHVPGPIRSRDRQIGTGEPILAIA